MGLRTRKLVGSAAIAIWLVVFCLVAIAIIGRFDRPNVVIEMMLYAGLGFAWILPLKPVFVWMGRSRKSE